VVVVGGGITGAVPSPSMPPRRRLQRGAARGADFASGTSSRSSKLVHGGLRYLQNFDLGLVREAMLERQLMGRAGSPSRAPPAARRPWPSKARGPTASSVLSA